MLEMMIKGLFEGLPPEAKSGLNKLNEFMPVIEGYHNTIKLDSEKKELGVSYLLKFEKDGLTLYQIVLKANEQNKVEISRTLGKWNINEQVKKYSDND